MTALKQLDLNHAPITHNGLKHLCPLPALETLFLGSPNITGDSVPIILTMKGLKKLTLSDNALRESELKTLQQALPQCKIHLLPT